MAKLMFLNFCFKLIIYKCFSITIRKVKVQTSFWYMVQFFRRYIVTTDVPVIVCKLKFIGLWMSVKTDGVSNSFYKGFLAAIIRINSGNNAMGCIWFTDIAWNTCWHIQLAIRPKVNEFPTMMKFFGLIIINNYRFGRINQLPVNILIAYYPVDFHNIEVFIFKCGTIGYV